MSVYQEQKTRHSFYGNLIQCGSVWACPVCSAKIANRRAEEIKTAVEWAYKNDLKAVMVTVTFPHRISDTLKDSRAKFSEALKALRKGRLYDEWRKATGNEGLIRSWEITYGENGWHLHSHELMFVKKDVDAVSMHSFLLKRWETACEKVGLLDKDSIEAVEAFRKHSLNILDNAKSSDYLVKYGRSSWGIEDEIAKGSTKKGSKGGVHPFQLLEKADDSLETKRMHNLYTEYAFEMKGAKQIYWSRGLKSKCGVHEKTDEDLILEQLEEASILAKLTPNQWKIVKKCDARSEILDIAEIFGYQGLRAWFKLRGEILEELNNNTEDIFSETGPPIYSFEVIP